MLSSLRRYKMHSTRFVATVAVCAVASAALSAYYYFTTKRGKAAAGLEQPHTTTSSHGDEEVTAVPFARASSALVQLQAFPSERDSVQQAGIAHVSTIAGRCEFRQASLAEQQVSEATLQQQPQQQPQTESGSPLAAVPLSLSALPPVAAGLRNLQGPLPPVFEINNPQQLHQQQQPGNPITAASISATPPVAAGPGLGIWRGQVNPIFAHRLPEAETEHTVFVKGVGYSKVGRLGTGASSQVYKVADPLGRNLAVKRVAVAGTDERAATGYVRELELLQRLEHKPHIIQLVNYQVLPLQGLIYLVLECGQSSLECLLQKRNAARRAAVGCAAAHGQLLTHISDENFIKLCWQHMLKAVFAVHDQHIVHRDVKPDNFVLVGHELKLIDFGIARTISKDGECVEGVAAGTVPYMAPEVIERRWTNTCGVPYIELGRPCDVWALGCILYMMVYGRQPFAHLGSNEDIQQAICSHTYHLDFPVLANTHLVDVMQRCLDRDPRSRITVQELLQHPYLNPGAVNIASVGGPSGAYRPLMNRCT